MEQQIIQSASVTIHNSIISIHSNLATETQPDGQSIEADILCKLA